MKPSPQEMLNKGVYDWFLGEQQKEPGVKSEAAGEGEGSAAAQKPGEPPQGWERGRQEALSGERRWHETHWILQQSWKDLLLLYRKLNTSYQLEMITFHRKIYFLVRDVSLKRQLLKLFN